MSEDFIWNDRYAGDAAWKSWFRLCSVGKCSAAESAALRAEVESAMFTGLARLGLGRDAVGEDDPVAFFDSYFQLKGSRDAPKPLKAYFAYRMAKEGLRMRDFVCGTLFGTASGRIRDIVVDWVAVNKGWKPRTVSDVDGKRRLAWENAVDESVRPEQASESEGVDFIDEEPVRTAVIEALERTSRKIRVEKSKIALLSLAVAMDISLSEPAVLAGLGVAKSMAYRLKDKAMKAFEKELRRTEGVESPLFGRLLLEVCEAELDPAVRRSLEEAK